MERTGGAETPAEGADYRPAQPDTVMLTRLSEPVLRGRRLAIAVVLLVAVGIVVALVLTRGSSTPDPGKAFVAELNDHGWGIEADQEAGLAVTGRGICDYWEAGGFAFGAEQQMESAGLSPKRGAEILAASTHAFCPRFVSKLKPENYYGG